MPSMQSTHRARSDDRKVEELGEFRFRSRAVRPANTAWREAYLPDNSGRK
jgi:hypothetical protein